MPLSHSGHIIRNRSNWFRILPQRFSQGEFESLLVLGAFALGCIARNTALIVVAVVSLIVEG